MTMRLFAVAAWRQAPYFTGDERAALALAEAVTRLSDRADPVPDAIWELALTGPGAITYGRRRLLSLKLTLPRLKHVGFCRWRTGHGTGQSGPVEKLAGTVVVAL